MASFNKVILIGNLTAAPELKKTPSGVSVTSFIIAVNRRFAKDGQQQTDFINIVAWRQTAEFVARYFNKGKPILICGQLQTRSWTDQQNNKRIATEVIVDEANFVDSKADAPAGSSSYSDAPAFQTQQAPKFEEIASDDDLPF